MRENVLCITVNRNQWQRLLTGKKALPWEVEEMNMSSE